MEYNKKDFARIRFNLYAPGFFGDNLNEELSFYPEFRSLFDACENWSSVDFKIIFSWISFCFDKNSPYLDYELFEKRSMRVMHDLGVVNNNGRLKKSYLDISVGISRITPIVNRAIIRYCRLQNDHLFEEVALYQFTLCKTYGKLADGKSQAKDEKDLISNITSMTKRISDNKKEMLSNNNSIALHEDFLEEIQNQNIQLTPEDLNKNRKLRDLYREELNLYKGWRFERFDESDLSDQEYDKMEKEMCNDTDEARKIFQAQGLKGEVEPVIAKQKQNLDRILSKEKEKRNERKIKEAGG